MLKSLFHAICGAMVTCIVYTVIDAATPHLGLYNATPTATAAAPIAGQAPLTVNYGIYQVDTTINGSAPIAFGLDSGAAGMNMPRSVLNKLIAEGRVSKADDINQPATTVLADGRLITSPVYMLRSVTIAGRTLQNVPCTVGGEKDLALLGQSVLARFNSWAVDNQHRTLTVI